MALITFEPAKMHHDMHACFAMTNAWIPAAQAVRVSYEQALHCTALSDHLVDYISLHIHVWPFRQVYSAGIFRVH